MWALDGMCCNCPIVLRRPAVPCLRGQLSFASRVQRNLLRDAIRNADAKSERTMSFAIVVEVTRFRRAETGLTRSQGIIHGGEGNRVPSEATCKTALVGLFLQPC